MPFCQLFCVCVLMSACCAPLQHVFACHGYVDVFFFRIVFTFRQNIDLAACFHIMYYLNVIIIYIKCRMN